MSPHSRAFRFGINVAAPAGESVIALAREAEALGYAVFSSPDHLNLPATPLEPMALLAAVAAATSRIELQPLVLANDFRHPALLAKQAATIDVLSGGRFALGIGAGWYGPDFTAPGLPFHRPPLRIARVREALAVIRGLHRGEPFTFSGEHFQVADMAGLPVPARSPMPLLLGGSGPAMLALAAREADTVALNPGLPIGTPLPASATPYADVTDRKLAWIRAAAPERFPTLEIQSSILAAGITDGDPEAIIAPVAGLLGVPPSHLSGSPHVLAGTLEQCVETVLGWRERWGISYLTFPAPAARELAPLVERLRGR